ncbi:hypothetical protein ACFO3O_20480 [Dokdonia ponticola]|uniref:SGNH/GDSL hydrolase family protein n=1 Tax=Dokdonia ponticola TaxID=2041041 RepID=A0ABV9I3M2_9FLAO
MKRFIKHILFLIGVLLVLLFVLDALYTKVYRESVPRNKVANLMAYKGDAIDYVFIGSSRVDNTIDAALIERKTEKTAINLGVQGGKLDDYYLMLQLLVDKKIQTETVFIQLDYVYNIDGTSEILKSELMPYIENPIIDAYVKERDLSYKTLRYVPFVRYMKFDYKIGFREFFSSSIGKLPKTNLSNGYSPKYNSQGATLKYSLPTKMAATNSVIQKIEKLANDHQINLIFFTAPFCGATQNFEYIDQLKERFPTLIDYSRVFVDRDDYFYNCSHLNHKGAQEFTNLFVKAYLQTPPN